MGSETLPFQIINISYLNYTYLRQMACLASMFYELYFYSPSKVNKVIR